ncbi:MAG: hypothetical protein FJW39_20030 [Acidobacteria bacterium]|nr:hypothetical protein [Acidobacteriota bacterium]
MPACLFKLRPTGPWRLGPDSGARDRVERVCHSDTLYSAVSQAMVQLGWGEEWFAATAQASPAAVRLGSLFPWQEDALYAPVPGHLWPPPGVSKLRAWGARSVPTYLVGWLASGSQFNEEQWEVDGLSECLLRRGRRHAGPFRVALRRFAAVDRMEHGSMQLHQTACLEFADGAGLWFAAECEDDMWGDRLESAIRLLGDSGIGGERSLGWGHFEVLEAKRGSLEKLIFGPRYDAADGGEQGYWMLSLLNPGPADRIDWERGAYSVVERRGRGLRPVRMIREGSVLIAQDPPHGAAPDVAPEGSPHPVYRAGLGLPVALPWRGNP